MSVYDKIPTFAPILRRLPALRHRVRMPAGRTWWRLVRWAVVGVSVFVTLIAVFYAVENHRGRRAWEAARAEARAAGLPSSLSEAAPAEVADTDNFLLAPEVRDYFAAAARAAAEGQGREWAKSTPFNRALEPVSPLANRSDALELRKPPAALSEWRAYLGAEDLLRHLAPYAQDLERMSLASFRTGFYRKSHDYGDVGQRLWGTIDLMRAGDVLVLRARARLAAGEAQGAAGDLAAALRLAGVLTTDPFVLSQLAAHRVSRAAVAAIREGLAGGAWTDADLVALDVAASRADHFEGAHRAFRMEFTHGITMLRNFAETPGAALRHEMFSEGTGLEIFPSEWWPVSARGHWFEGSPESGAEANRALLKLIGSWLPGGEARLLEWMPHGWWLSTAAHVLRERQHDVTNGLDANARVAGVLGKAVQSEEAWTPYRRLRRAFDNSGFGTLIKSLLEAQVEVDLARVGIAVERWRKARGSYPESLDELSVVNLALPHDVMTGNPLIYRRRGDTFTLYSAGLDRVDNGGIQADERRRTQEGDWVW